MKNRRLLACILSLSMTACNVEGTLKSGENEQLKQLQAELEALKSKQTTNDKQPSDPVVTQPPSTVNVTNKNDNQIIVNTGQQEQFSQLESKIDELRQRKTENPAQAQTIDQQIQELEQQKKTLTSLPELVRAGSKPTPSFNDPKPTPIPSSIGNGQPQGTIPTPTPIPSTIGSSPAPTPTPSESPQGTTPTSTPVPSTSGSSPAPTPTATATPTPVSTPTPTPTSLQNYSNSLGMNFKLIPAGTFTMGSPESELGRGTNETQHQVTLTQSFYMQTTEVTQGQWLAVMGSYPGTTPEQYGNGENYPMYYVNWNDTQSFITALNALGQGTYRLPTEAEWEYAARAGSTTAFANGDITQSTGSDPILDVIGWYTKNSDSANHPVAQKQPNAWGIYDMHGNAFEWVQDWYGDYPTSSVTNPTGPYSGLFHIFRGGSWFHNARYCRSAYRYYVDPSFQDRHLGFRLLRAL